MRVAWHRRETAFAAGGLCLVLLAAPCGVSAQRDDGGGERREGGSDAAAITARPVPAEGEDGEGRAPAGASAATPRAMPVSPSEARAPRRGTRGTPVPGAAGSRPPPSMRTSLPPQPASPPTPSTQRPTPGAANTEAGPRRGGPSDKIRPGTSISGQKRRARIIEETRPERVPVYPDDPDSAWWEIDPSYAFDRAQREMKPLLLLFTGKWNSRAMSLSEEVFATKSFNGYVKENFVICYLEYPRNVTEASDPLRHIKEKFQVHGYPSVLVFNPAGEVEREVRGYHPGRPVDYFNELKVACRPVLHSIEDRRAGLVKRGYRTWKSGSGKEIFAEFVEHDGRHVVLCDATGRDWTASLEDLTPEDQRLVKSFPPAQEMIVEPDAESQD